MILFVKQVKGGGVSEGQAGKVKDRFSGMAFYDLP